jgi:hypothetical protein
MVERAPFWIFATMDSHSRAFETPAESHPASPALFSPATPLPCPRVMRPQTITVWTPYRILGAVLMALLAVPRTLVLVPAAIRRRA